MTMSGANSGSITEVPVDGILDTGLIIIAHFDNPIQDIALEFLSEVFAGRTPLVHSRYFLQII